MGVSQQVSILSMRIDIFMTGQCIWLGTQPSCVVVDQVIEPREIFQPTDLEMGELLGGGHEVLEVLVVREHKHDMCRALEVVAPLSEGLKYGKQFLVIDLVELRRLHAARVECDWVDVAIIRGDLGDDRCDSIVRSVSFNNNWVIGVEVRQDGCLGKGCLERFERLGVIGAPGKWGVLAGEANQGDDDVGEPHNESSIEVGKAQECLHCFEIC